MDLLDQVTKLHGEKKIVALLNWIIDIELTKFFHCLNKFSAFLKNLFVEQTKSFIIVFCLTKLFVRRNEFFFFNKKFSTIFTVDCNTKCKL